jgi:hypothetical protein
MTKIDELMYLAGLYALQVKYDSENARIGMKTDGAAHYEKSLREALEAALKPGGEPDPSCDDVRLAETILSDCGHSTNNTRLLERVTDRIATHTAPPAQTPSCDHLYKAWQAVGADVAGLKWEDFVAHLPAQKPQPRLTDIEIGAIESAVLTGDGDYTGALRAVETAVRKQFGVNDE